MIDFPSLALLGRALRRGLDFGLGGFFSPLEVAGAAETFYDFVILFAHKVSLLCGLDSVVWQA